MIRISSIAGNANGGDGVRRSILAGGRIDDRVRGRYEGENLQGRGEISSIICI